METKTVDLQVDEIIEIHWPMIIPERANFAISSPRPIILSGPSPSPIQIHALTPIHLWNDHKIRAVPAGPATPGFAKGWLKLPNELKFLILRHSLIYGAYIWPSNVNRVIRNDLLPYLRMTPDIADIARAVFYGENTFIMQFSGSGSHYSQYEGRRAIPPLGVRPLLRRIKIVTWLSHRDWHMLKLISRREGGFANLVYLKIRCMVGNLAQALTTSQLSGKEIASESFDEFLERQLGPPVHCPFDGVVVFDRSGMRESGMDGAAWERLQQVEAAVKQHIIFVGNSISDAVVTYSWHSSIA